MWIIIVTIVAFIMAQAAGQGWKLYMHDPGPAEYLVSLIFTAAIISWVLGLFRRL